jgi:hypothetical protein
MQANSSDAATHAGIEQLRKLWKIVGYKFFAVVVSIYR